VSLDTGDPLPAIVVRAQNELRCRELLSRMGYGAVRSAYRHQQRTASSGDAFYALRHEEVVPAMDFVGDWLREEKKLLVARVRWTFFGAALTAIVAGFAFVAGLAALG
jgi:hypothetical protein